MKAQIAAIEYTLPDQYVTNDDLDALHPEWSIHKVAERTGVMRRYVCREDETSLDLAEIACEKLLQRGLVARDDIGAIIVCTQSPDYIMPPNSTLLQHRLQLPETVAAFDYSLACSGFIYGLFMGKALIESQMLDNILLVTSEAYSKYLSPNDRATMVLFGDGAAATLLRRGDTGVGEVVLGTDGAGGERFIIPAGGARLPRSQETAIEHPDNFGNSRSQDNIYMDGQAMLSFVKRRVPASIKTLLGKSGYTSEDISMFVFHQASGLALDHLEKSLAIPPNKMWRNLADVGNTVSASIPIAIKDADSAGRITAGSRLVLAGFGVGFSWGACIVDW